MIPRVLGGDEQADPRLVSVDRWKLHDGRVKAPLVEILVEREGLAFRAEHYRDDPALVASEDNMRLQLFSQQRCVVTESLTSRDAFAPSTDFQRLEQLRALAEYAVKDKTAIEQGLAALCGRNPFRRLGRQRFEWLQFLSVRAVGSESRGLDEALLAKLHHRLITNGIALFEQFLNLLKILLLQAKPAMHHLHPALPQPLRHPLLQLLSLTMFVIHH